MKIDFLKIKSGFCYPHGKKKGFDSYVSSMEHLVKEMIPKNLFDSEVVPPHFLSYDSYFQKVNEVLPLVSWSSIENAPCSVSIAVLSAAEFTHGLGRFFCDTMALNLIPGKQIPITVIRSLNFRFIIHPKDRYFITEIYVDIETKRDLHQVRQNLPRLAEEVRLTLLATEHARKLVLSKPLTLDEKKMVLAENLSSLVNRQEKELDHNILEKTHYLLLKVAHHEKPEQIPDHLLPLMEENPQAFDHNMFQGIQSLLLMFGKNMISKRDIHHLYRTISYLYLFRKIINYRRKTEEKKNLVSVKILRTKIEPQTPVLAIFLCVNCAKKNETLNHKNFIEAIQNILPFSHLVEDSLTLIPKDKEQTLTVYLEMARDNLDPFSQADTKELKRKLPKEIHSSIQSILPDRLYDQNEEEVMRNILTLSKQLKSPQDTPPVIIHFSTETEDTVTFTVILVSVHHSNFQLKSNPHIKILSHQIKIAGILNKRHLQNAHIIELKLEKASFIGKDQIFSLYEARKSILTFLKNQYGLLRDFNSGMIVKQYESLSKLKALASQDTLVEKYFYSLTPGCMQSLLKVETLHVLYEMLIKNLEVPLLDSPCHLTSQSTDDKLLIMINSKSDEMIDQIKQETSSLISSSSDLAMCDVSSNNIRSLGLIFSVENPNLKQEFLRQIASLIKSLDPSLAPTL